MKITRKNLMIVILTILVISLIISLYWLYSLYDISGIYAGLFIYMIAIGSILIIFKDVFPEKVKCEICGSVMRKHETKKNVYVCNHCNREFKIQS